MKRYAKIVQADSRGQIVIPKDVRHELGIDEGAGFYMYVIENEGILLKSVPQSNLSDSHIIKEIELNGAKIGVKKKNLDASVESYKKIQRGNLQNIT